CVVVRMRMVVGIMAFSESLFSPEGHYHQARHVDRGQQSSDRADKPKRFAEVRRHPGNRTTPCLPKDLVFRKEAGKDGHATDRQPARAHGQPGDGHVLAQVSHAAHVLLVMHAMNYRTGTKEELRFEESVSHHVEYRCDKRAHPTSEKHVAQL